MLSEFRTRVVALTAEERFLEAMVDLCKEPGWLKVRGRQRTDSTHILAKVRALNRAECVIETLRHALNVLAVVAPDWLRSQTGWNGLDIEPKNIASPMARRSEKLSCSKWVRTAGDCSLP